MTAAALRRRRRALREWGELRRVRRAHPWVGPIDLAMLRRALRLAARAARRGEVPVGAVVYRGREVIAEAANDREATGDPTGHAEVVALREAGRRLGAWRLSGTRLAVTLEPCPMCAGALVNARVDHLVFSAYDPKAGACGTLFEIPCDERLNHRLLVAGGVYKARAVRQLRSFFGARRRRSS